MYERSISVFKENFARLMADSVLHCKIERGVSLQLAKAIASESDELTPSLAFETWRALCANPDEIESFALICRYLPLASPEDVSEPHHETAVYFRNQVSDKAYDEFSRIHRNLGASYAPDFKSVCEDVYYDRADACILPLESSEDGLLMSFRHMVMRYELRITSAVRITTGEDTYQVMALLTNGNTDPNGDVCEMFLPDLSTDHFSATLKGLEALGARILRITSVPSKSGRSYDHHVCFTASPDVSRNIRFFLDAVTPANILLGQYKKYTIERNIP